MGFPTRCSNNGFSNSFHRTAVYILVILFALSSWIDINGVWVELPLLVPRLPEKWGLPSYMAVLIQMANIGPLLVTLYNYYGHRSQRNGHCDVFISYVIISVGIISCLLLAMFWDRTSQVFGKEHSTALLSLCFFLAFVDCTSSVVFLPFMAQFRPEFMTAFFIGEGFSGLVPSIAALIQGVGGNPDCVWKNSTSTNSTTNTTVVTPYLVPEYSAPLFEVEDFFFILMGLMSLSFVSLVLLNHWGVALRERVLQGGVAVTPTVQNASGTLTRNRRHSRRQRVDENDSVSDLSYQMSRSSSVAYEEPIWQATNNQSTPNMTVVPTGNSSAGMSTQNSQVDLVTVLNPCEGNAQSITIPSNQQHLTLPHTPLITDGRISTPEKEVMPMLLKSHVLTNCDFSLLLFAQAFICALCNGVLPSIQSYASLPYGNEAYHLSVTLSSLANPLACFLALWLPTRSRRVILVLTFLGSVLSGFVVFLAASSPHPPLKGVALGIFFIVAAQVAIQAFFSYSKVAIATLLREEGRRALVWCGAVTQAGSSVGALIMFPLVNIYYLFKSNEPCI